MTKQLKPAYLAIPRIIKEDALPVRVVPFQIV